MIVAVWFATDDGFDGATNVGYLRESCLQPAPRASSLRPRLSLPAPFLFTLFAWMAMFVVGPVAPASAIAGQGSEVAEGRSPDSLDAVASNDVPSGVLVVPAVSGEAEAGEESEDWDDSEETEDGPFEGKAVLGLPSRPSQRLLVAGSKASDPERREGFVPPSCEHRVPGARGPPRA